MLKYNCYTIINIICVYKIMTLNNFCLRQYIYIDIINVNGYFFGYVYVQLPGTHLRKHRLLLNISDSIYRMSFNNEKDLKIKLNKIIDTFLNDIFQNST